MDRERAARLPGAPAQTAHLRRRDLLAGTGVQSQFQPLRLRTPARLVRGIPRSSEDEIASAMAEDDMDEGDSLGGYFSKN